MEWLKAFRGHVVGLDTAPLIYFIEENPAYMPLVRPFFEAADRGFQIVTSILTLTEVLVHPLRRVDPRLADQYRRILLRGTTGDNGDCFRGDGRESRGIARPTRTAYTRRCSACNRNTVRSRFILNE
jgi:hypothetical protein